MTQLRMVLIVIGVVLGSALFFIVGTFGVNNPWDVPSTSPRHWAYDYLFVKHRWVTVAVFAVYFGLLAVAFKQEFLESFRKEGISEFKIRFVCYSVLLLILLGTMLWSR